MKVILLDNIRGIGRVGDIKNVSDGYAKNFLIPHKLARVATQGGIKDVEGMKSKKLEAQTLATEEAKAVAAKIQGLRIQVKGKANSKGTLFAALEPSHIADMISTAAGVHISTQALVAADHIKEIGDHAIRINLPGNQSATVTLSVTAQ